MYIKNPMNYTGGKTKVLGDILKIFPDNIETFVALFTGGFNVGANINAKRLICNDHNTYIISLYFYLTTLNTQQILEEVNNVISTFNLSKVNENGYRNLINRYNQKKTIYRLISIYFLFF